LSIYAVGNGSRYPFVGPRPGLDTDAVLAMPHFKVAECCRWAGFKFQICVP